MGGVSGAAGGGGPRSAGGRVAMVVGWGVVWEWRVFGQVGVLRLRRWNFWILPVEVLGRESTNSMVSGVL